MILEPSEILFLGLGKSAVLWYRCALPAMAIGADWCGVAGDPPTLYPQTGLVKGNTVLPDYKDYKVVILQQPRGTKWLRLIRRLQADGVKVLYEVDDYLHGVRKQKGHDFKGYFDKPALRELELCMRACDGMIVSTPWLGRKYRSFNKNVYVCPNGLDVGRYRLTKPERETVNIGWAGATGHIEPLLPWLNDAVIPIMAERKDVCFVCIGQPGIVVPIQQMFGQERALGVPFTLIENYPAAMTMIDIAIAPAGKTQWYRGKSDLRWLEAGALGIPIVADRAVYPGIDHGVTGYHADDPTEVRAILNDLIDDPAKRAEVGQAAKDHVLGERDATVAGLRWLEVCRAVAGDYASPALFE